MTERIDVLKTMEIVAGLAVVIGGLAWKFTRPACSSFLFFLLGGKGEQARFDKCIAESVERNSEVHEARVRGYFAEEFQRSEERDQRITELEQVTAAQDERLGGFEAALKAQGTMLSTQIAQVFDPLHRTLEKMEGALERIAADTNKNSVSIGELRGLWDGAERRDGRDRRTGGRSRR